MGQKHHNHNQDKNRRVPPVKSAFNHSAHPGVEEEVKWLAREDNFDFSAISLNDNLSEAAPVKIPASLKKIQFLPQVYFDLAKSLKKYIIGESVKELCTRQMEIINPDTMEFELGVQGFSLRFRGEMDANGNVVSADGCIKITRSENENGALIRGEFETEVSDFENPDIEAFFKDLKKKYPRKDHPDLHAMLGKIDLTRLKEAGRINCLRRRALVDLPPEITGIADNGSEPKKFVAELQFDDVLNYIDSRVVSGLASPWVLKQDFEIEFEPHIRACEFDDAADKESKVSRNLTDNDIQKGELALIRLIEKAGGEKITRNLQSKASRLLNVLQKIASVGNYFRANGSQDEQKETPGIRTAFSVISPPTLRWPANDNQTKEVVRHRSALVFNRFNAA